MTTERPVLLVVDDEVRILTALRRVLRREAYEILTAETPAEALRLLDAHRVDLVLSDHKMPGMSGLALLAAAARKQPAAGRVLITGWTEEVPAEDLAAIGVRALLPKPWDDADLKATLRKALGR
ncbi:MAG: response regulator [Deltaproteobacteria bacterium]|nr:response regulator [Deltaproteobacteria bacterium]